MILCVIFRDDSYGEKDVERYARYAVTCYKSWKYNCDPVPDVAFYVEDKCVDTVYRVLYDENKLDAHVFEFNSAELIGEDRIWARLGKKACLYIDPQFSDTEWVSSSDADLWICKPKDALPLDYDLRKLNHERIALAHWSDIDASRIEEDREKVFADMSEEDEFFERYKWQIETSRIPHQEILPKDMSSDFRSLCDRFGASGYYKDKRNTFGYYMTKAWLYAYPAKHFHANRQDFIEYVKQAAPLFGCDETLLRVWHYKAQEKIDPLLSVLDIPSYHFNDGEEHDMQNIQDFQRSFIAHGHDGGGLDSNNFRKMLEDLIGSPIQ